MALGVCVSVLPCVCAWEQDTGRTHIAFNRWISILRMKMNRKQLKYFSAYRSIRHDSTVCMHYSFHIYILLYVEPTERKKFQAAERKKKLNEISNSYAHVLLQYVFMSFCVPMPPPPLRYRRRQLENRWRRSTMSNVKVHSTHTHTYSVHIEGTRKRVRETTPTKHAMNY